MASNKKLLEPCVIQNLDKDTRFCPSLGQTKIITDIVEILSSGKIRLVVLSGPAGSGKSYVAARIANHLVVDNAMSAYPVQLRAHATVTEVIRHLTTVLQLPQSTGKVRAFCKHVRQSLQGKKRYLIVFENVETFVYSNQCTEEIGIFLDLCTALATTKGVHIMLTSRVRMEFSRDLSMVEIRSIPPFTPEESTELIHIVAGKNRTFSSICYMQIFKYTGGLPRKLIEAGLKMKQTKDFTIESQGQSLTDGIPLTEMMILNDIGRTLRDNLVTLSYFPGSFSAEAAAAVFGSQRSSFAKHDVLSPLHSHCLISTTDDPMQRFEVQPFLRRFLEELYRLYQNSDVKIRNRFCVFFAHVMKQMTEMEIHERHGQRFSLFTMEIDNLQKLLLEAVHCLDENYDLFFDVAYNAEYYITNLLPKRESVDFYESMCNAAARHSTQHHGIMLSAFGQVLAFAQNRHDEAYQQYMKALDCLRPLGESTDLAWLYTHIGFIWHELGKFKKAERYFNISVRMMGRQNIRLSHQEKQYSNVSRPRGIRQARILLNRYLGGVLSALGTLYTYTGNYEKSIECHEKAMVIRRQLFGIHPVIGGGYNNLCLVYDKAGQRGKALEYAKKGLHIKKLFLKHPSNTVLVSLLNVALFTHTEEGDTEKSLRYLAEAYEIRKALGLRHGLTGVIEDYRGDMQLHSKRWQQAAESFSKAVHWYRLTETSPRTTAEALFKCGVALKYQGLYDEAEQKLTESRQISRELMAEGQSMSRDSKNIGDTVKELEDLKRLRIEESRR